MKVLQKLRNNKFYFTLLILCILLGIYYFNLNITNYNTDNSDIQSDYKFDSSIKFIEEIEPNLNFHYCFPHKFHKQEDSILCLEPIIYISEDKEAELTYFTEYNYLDYEDQPVYTTNSFTKLTEGYFAVDSLKYYYNKIISGNHSNLSGKLTILKSSYKKYTGRWGYGSYFIILGHIGGKEFLWKTFVSMIPIDGFYVFKNMLFTYPINKNKYYQTIAIETAKKFKTVM